jgi:hypothetical protein
MPIEFPAESVGLQAQCRFCRKQTELRLAVPDQGWTIPRRTIVWTVMAIIVLVFGLAGTLFALKRAQRLAETRKAPPAAAQPNQ